LLQQTPLRILLSKSKVYQYHTYLTVMRAIALHLHFC